MEKRARSPSRRARARSPSPVSRSEKPVVVVDKKTVEALSPFLAADPSKRAAERFFQIYTPIWASVMGLVLLTGIWESFNAYHYLYLGIALTLPCFLYPYFYPLCEEDKKRPITDQFWFKLNVFCAILGYILSHLGTWWFYRVLGMRYTVPTDGWEVNGVPWSMIIFVHPYFCTYFAFANPAIRYIKSQTKNNVSLEYLAIAVLSYSTAFLETKTIESFPLYSFHDRWAALWIGSLFYGTVFVVSFPLFFVIDESRVLPRWSVWEVSRQALAASMLSLLGYEVWRLGTPRLFSKMNNIHHMPHVTSASASPVPPVPLM